MKVFNIMATETNEELRKFEKKQSCFRGSAKIHLKHINFECDDLYLDPKNVARLLQVFQLEGCFRLDLEHHIPAIIDEDELRRSLQKSGIASGDLFRRQAPPTLDLDTSTTTLKCLHGRHRIEAAKEHLLPGDKWWTVDLYSNGTL